MVAFCDNVVRNAFGHAFVKDEVDPAEPVLQAVLLDLAGVFDDAAFQLVHVGKPFVLEVSAGFFAPNAARAIEHDVFVFLVLKQGLHLLDFVAKGFRGGQDCTFEVADFALVVVAHVHHDGVRLAGQSVEFFGVDVFSAIGHIETVVVEAVCHNLVPDFDDQLEEALVVSFDGDVQSCSTQPVDVFEAALEVGHGFRGQAQLGIDALATDVDAAQHTDGTPH